MAAEVDSATIIVNARVPTSISPTVKPRRGRVLFFVTLALLGIIALVIWLAVALQSKRVDDFPAVDYGFPKCYTSFVDYNGAWINEPPVDQSMLTASNQGTELRPVTGQSLLPYAGFAVEDCTATAAPLLALGPHFVGLGLTEYRPTTAMHAFPDAFVGSLFVTSHGSWNRVPWLGYRVDAIDIDFSRVPYRVNSRAVFVPPMRVLGSGGVDQFDPPRTHEDYEAIRPVDVRSSPVDGSLLMTADRDDYMSAETGHNTGGLYRIRYGAPSMEIEPSTGGEAVIPRTRWPLDGVIGGDRAFSLERLAVLPCARQMTHSRTTPRLLYVSTLKEFCSHTGSQGEQTKIDRGAVWVVELDVNSGRVLRKARVIEWLLDPQGIDWANNTLYIATSGRGGLQRGNSVLRVRDIDTIAESVLANPHTALQGEDARIEDVLTNFTSLQAEGHSKGHAWRSLRVTPSGTHALVQIGSDCNWASDCVANATSEHTNLLAINVATGRYAAIGKGIRNAVGMHFDRNGNFLWIDNGSDMGEGMPGAPAVGNDEHGNRPDGELNVLYSETLSQLQSI